MEDKEQILRQQRLRPEVADQFTATITPCVIEIQRLGRKVDLTQLTLAEAEELVKDPLFTYLVAKKKVVQKAAPKKRKKNTV